MYHARFKNTHYEAGFKWGSTLRKHNIFIKNQHFFQITQERKFFTNKCIAIYEKYYPEILDEIKGISDGQKLKYENLCIFLLSMYCFEFNNHCTCFAFKNNNHIIFGRNSDFLVELEKLYMNCIYNLDNAYAFNGNTTAFVQMEDGINEHGLAAGLTFVYPKVREYGLNAGMLVRYILEKCKTTKEAISFLKEIPIASQQTLTIIDHKGDMAVIECNPYIVEVITPRQNEQFVVTANNFNSAKMINFKNSNNINDWNSKERYNTAYNALKAKYDKYSFNYAKDILSGKFGFICQYDRKTGADTYGLLYMILKIKKFTE